MTKLLLGLVLVPILAFMSPVKIVAARRKTSGKKQPPPEQKERQGQRYIPRLIELDPR